MYNVYFQEACSLILSFKSQSDGMSILYFPPLHVIVSIPPSRSMPHNKKLSLTIELLRGDNVTTDIAAAHYRYNGVITSLN